jgi:hypothetical protein
MTCVRCGRKRPKTTTQSVPGELSVVLLHDEWSLEPGVSPPLEINTSINLCSVIVAIAASKELLFRSSRVADTNLPFDSATLLPVTQTISVLWARTTCRRQIYRADSSEARTGLGLRINKNYTYGVHSESNDPVSTFAFVGSGLRTSYQHPWLYSDLQPR